MHRIIKDDSCKICTELLRMTAGKYCMHRFIKDDNCKICTELLRMTAGKYAHNY
jgi:hypothetical protein